MGSDKLFHWNKRKQQSGSSNSVYNAGDSNFGDVYNRNNMAESKMMLLLLKIIIPPIYIWAWIINLDNTKSTILFIGAMIMAMVRFYFFARRQSQVLEKGRQEAEMRNLDIKERHQKTKEIELKLLEEELSLRVTGLTVEERHKRDKK